MCRVSLNEQTNAGQIDLLLNDFITFYIILKVSASVIFISVSEVRSLELELLIRC